MKLFMIFIVTSTILLCFLHGRRSNIIEYQENLKRIGYLKVYICLDDGGYRKGFITKAQYRLFNDTVHNKVKLNVKSLHPEKEEIILYSDNIFYIERIN